MAVLPLLKATDPLLREVMPTYDFPEHDLTVQAATDLSESLLHHGGIGLAAG